MRYDLSLEGTKAGNIHASRFVSKPAVETAQIVLRVAVEVENRRKCPGHKVAIPRARPLQVPLRQVDIHEKLAAVVECDLARAVQMHECRKLLIHVAFARSGK